MKCICLIGKKRTGKTTYTIDLINKIGLDEIYIFDVNKEYQQRGIKNLYTGPIQHEHFLNFVSQKKNSVIVFEEAAAYFSNRENGNRLKDLMQRSRHTNNVIIIIFHGIADLPQHVYTRIDYMGLFKTQDFENTLDAKFRKNEQFMHFFKNVKESENPHHIEFFEIE
jgi:hypothetical protein